MRKVWVDPNTLTVYHEENIPSDAYFSTDSNKKKWVKFKNTESHEVLLEYMTEEQLRSRQWCWVEKDTDKKYYPTLEDLLLHSKFDRKKPYLIVKNSKGLDVHIENITEITLKNRTRRNKNVK